MAVDEVHRRARAAARRRRHALLHGRGLARRAATAPSSTRVLRDGPRRRRPRAGGLLHARHAHRRARPRRLKEAGLSAYNHNLDTSPEFYGQIITTRTYDDRLRHARARARRRHLGLLRRHHRPGRIRRRSDRAARSSSRRRRRIPRACRSTSWSRRRHAAGRRAAARPAGARADDRDGAHSDAARRWSASPPAATR